MSSQFPQLGEAVEWNLVARATYQANQTLERLTPRQYLIENSNLLIVGVQTTGPMVRSTWYTGGYAKQLLPFLPSSTSIFPAIVQGSSRRLRLGTMTLCQFPERLPTWILELSFPKWFENVTVEIWRYDGLENDSAQQLEEIKAKIDNL